MANYSCLSALSTRFPLRLSLFNNDFSIAQVIQCWMEGELNGGGGGWDKRWWLTSCGLHKDAGLRKITNRRQIIVHAPIIEFANSVIRNTTDVILTSAAFLVFSLKKKKIWEELKSPTSLHMTKLARTTQLNFMKFSLLTITCWISTPTEFR